MYISEVSLRNFGPFSKANFEFSGHGINVVVGSNATGKTQLCGAIVAAIVGRSAIQIREEGVGPSKVSATLNDGTLSEVTTLSVTKDLHAAAIVSHAPCPLAIKILATMSDKNGPRLVLTEESVSDSLTQEDLEVAESHLPEHVRHHERWSWLRSQARSTQYSGSRGEYALACLVREFAVRKKSRLTLPLMVDEFGTRWDEATQVFAAEILKAIATSSQVIVFTSKADLLAYNAILSLAQSMVGRISLAGYNNRLFSPKNLSFLRRKVPLWIKGAKFPLQENRSCELKEVKGGNPLSSIKSLVDQYAVAFMNAGVPQDGSIFWGVRDEDQTIVGVSLTERECDELRRVVTEKLHQIIPAIAPSAYQIELHPVSDGKRKIDDLYIVEVRIPSVRRTLLFATGSQEVYVKTDAGKRRLSAVEIQYELLRRVGVDPNF